MWQMALKILEDYGPYGVGYLLLIYAVYYFVRKNASDRAEYREDFNRQHDMHRMDRNEWVETLKSQNDKVLAAFDENSKALGSHAVAMKELSVHIQSCTSRRG